MPKITAIVSKETNRISLLQSHDYEVIGIESEDYRIIDESGEPALYPKSYFLDETITPPDGWIYHDFGNDEYSYYPEELAAIGFFEDYADGQEAAVRCFRNYLQSRRKER